MATSDTPTRPQTNYAAIHRATGRATERLRGAAMDYGNGLGVHENLDRELRASAAGIAIELLRGAAEMDPDRADAHNMSLSILEAYYAGASGRKTYP